MPESPRWLCTKDRNEEAFNILCQLHSSPEDHDNNLAQHEFHQISLQTHLETNQSFVSGWKAAFANKSFRKRLLIGFFVQYVLLFPIT